MQQLVIRWSCRISWWCLHASICGACLEWRFINFHAECGKKAIRRVWSKTQLTRHIRITSRIQSTMGSQSSCPINWGGVTREQWSEEGVLVVWRAETTMWVAGLDSVENAPGAQVLTTSHTPHIPRFLLATVHIFNIHVTDLNVFSTHLCGPLRSHTILNQVKIFCSQ